MTLAEQWSVAEYSTFHRETCFQLVAQRQTQLLDDPVARASVHPVLAQFVRAFLPASSRLRSRGRCTITIRSRSVRSSFINRPPPGWHSNYRRSRFRLLVILVFAGIVPWRVKRTIDIFSPLRSFFFFFFFLFFFLFCSFFTRYPIRANEQRALVMWSRRNRRVILLVPPGRCLRDTSATWLGVRVWFALFFATREERGCGCFVRGNLITAIFFHGKPAPAGSESAKKSMVIIVDDSFTGGRIVIARGRASICERARFNASCSICYITLCLTCTFRYFMKFDWLGNWRPITNRLVFYIYIRSF